MINYNGKIKRISRAVDVCNMLLTDKRSYQSIINVKNYDMATCGSGWIAHFIKLAFESGQIQVKVYYPKWRWSKAIGYYTSVRPNDININGYMIKNRTVEQYVETIIHELTHLADGQTVESFGHGNNSPIGKENTAPWKIGKMFRMMAGERGSEVFENSNIRYVETKFSKVRRFFIRIWNRWF